MEALVETLTPLDSLEVNRAVQIAQDREDALYRGRAVFLCTAKHAVFEDLHLNIPNECVRIELQWEDEAVWQARAWNGEGELISDTVSDGEWVEAGGKRWYINYLLGPGDDERTQTVRETRDRRWDLEIELRKHLWCHNLCSSHLFLNHPTAQWGRTGPLHRDSETGHIVYRIWSREQRMKLPAVKWLRWLWNRLFCSETTLEHVTESVVVSPESDTRIYYDGEFLHPLRSELDIEAFAGLPKREIEEHWSEHTRLDNGFFVARVHEESCGFSRPTVLHRTELVESESDIGENAAVQVRPVDMSLPGVEW